MSRAGIIFTATGLRLGDQFGNRVMCTGCGGVHFDVTIRGDQGDKVECSNSECGRPITDQIGPDQEGTP